MKKKGPTILLVIIFLVGLSLLLYPTLSNYYNSFHQSRAIARYVEQVAEIDNKDYAKILKAARAYNKKMRQRGHLGLEDAEVEEYNRMLDIGDNGMMGYVEIPSLNVQLPIYHGTNDAILQIAIGHIEGSSLPVGGKGTHCVLSGHRGLPSAKLFTDLDKMREGDVFYLYVLDKVLTYEVDQIRIVEPEELDELQIEESLDLCTLVTCTPYGINTHRLLVRGHRIPNDLQEDVRVSLDAMRIDPVIVAPLVAIPILLLLLIWFLFRYRKPKKQSKKRISGKESK